MAMISAPPRLATLHPMLHYHLPTLLIPSLASRSRRTEGVTPRGLVPPRATSTDLLFSAAQSATLLVQDQLASTAPTRYLVLTLAGLVTSLTPCTLSVLPLTVGFIAGYGGSDEPVVPLSPGLSSLSLDRTSNLSSVSVDNDEEEDGRVVARTVSSSSTSTSGGGKSSLFVNSLSFSFGLASTFTALGLISTLLGRTYGSIGDLLPTISALISILMGLQLLNVLPPLPISTLNLRTRAAQLKGVLPPPLACYLAGGAFALAASPCATPVLAALLAYVATLHDVWQGGGLLFAYSLGYVAPLLVAATATGAVTKMLALRKATGYVTTGSGVLLLAGGVYVLLSRIESATIV